MKKGIISVLVIVLAIFLGNSMIVYGAPFLVGVGGTGSTTPSGILYGDNGATTHLNTVTVGSGCTFVAGTLSCSGGASAFIPTSYGAATSTTLGLLGGFFTTASSTFSNLGTGAVYTQNGLLLSHATTSSSVAYQDLWRDANQNAFAQNFVSAATTFPSNGSTNTLTAASPRTWVITGTQTQGLKLPVGTTLTNGALYVMNNNSTLSGTFVDNGSNNIATIPSGSSAFAQIYDNSTSNGAWDSHAWLGHGNVSGTGTLGLSTTTPWAQLSVMGGGDYLSHAASTFFAIGSSTAGTATSTLFTVNSAGLASTTALTVSGATTLSSLANGCLNITSGLVGSVTCGTGTVTSVDGSGGTTGLTLTGGPITTSGTLTLGGTLAIASGGTNATSFTTSGNGVYWNGTSLLTAPLTSPVTYPYASTTAITGTTGTFSSFLGAGSTTPAFPLSVGNNGVGLYTTSGGETVGYDHVNAWPGRFSPTGTLVIPAATSTVTWTASSTPGVDVAPPIRMTFAGTMRQVNCNTNSFLGVTIKINSTAITPSYFIASSTSGLEKITANNTFVVGDLISATYGTTTSATASAPIYASCSIDATKTP